MSQIRTHLLALSVKISGPGQMRYLNKFLTGLPSLQSYCKHILYLTQCSAVLGGRKGWLCRMTGKSLGNCSGESSNTNLLNSQFWSNIDLGSCVDCGSLLTLKWNLNENEGKSSVWQYPHISQCIGQNIQPIRTLFSASERMVCCSKRFSFKSPQSLLTFTDLLVFL